MSAANRVGVDRRVLFKDLSQVPPLHRKAGSKVLNFYSAANNIGNYLPVMAIHQMLEADLDCWNVHDNNIDYDFINKNYESIIIGGAGLLHPVFNAFWSGFVNNCNLPFVIWGVGGCYPDNMNFLFDEKKRGGGVFCDGMLRAFRNAELINVRDYVTADFISRKDVSVTACPTLMLLKNYENPKASKTSNLIVYAPHSGLISRQEDEIVSRSIANKFGAFYLTENVQRMRFGLWDLVDTYKSADLVITSRLHGAITAWSLGVPFLALSRDRKMDGFAEFAGLKDVVFRDVNELMSNFDNVPFFDNDEYHEETINFAHTAIDWSKQYL